MKKELISKIKEFGPSNKNIKQLIVLNEHTSSEDIALLFNEFGYSRAKIENSINSYKNVAIIFDLVKEDETYLTDWHLFLLKYQPKKEITSRFDNIIVNKDYTKLLLITNKRLMHIDIKKLNEETSKINKQISIYNEEDSVDELAEEEKKGIMDSILSMFRK